MLFSERLQFLIDTNKIELEDLSKKLRVPVTTLEAWLRGDSKPNKREILQLAIILNIKSDYLFGLSNKPVYTGENQEINKIYQDKFKSSNKKNNNLDSSSLYYEMLLAGLLNNPVIEKQLGFSREDIKEESFSDFVSEVLHQIELTSWKYRNNNLKENKK